MEFIDLKAQYQKYKSELDQAIQTVLDRGDFINGQDVKLLEEEVAKYIGVKYAVSCNSGTDALLLALMALNLPKGSEVITTPFTFVATLEVIENLGLKAVLVDIDAESYNLNVDQIEAVITDKTKIIMPVHLFGQMANMAKVMEIAKKYDLKVIEDCAQAFGASCELGISGAVGDFGCHSFFPTKNLGGYGDGGMITTDDENFYNFLVQIRNHGQKEKYIHEKMGVSSRLDTIQAAVLRVKLKYFDEEKSMRQNAWKYYKESLENIEGLEMPMEKYGTMVPNMFCMKTEKRDELKEFLQNNGIPSMVYYPKPMHIQPYFMGKYGLAAGDFPISERVSDQILALPFGSFVSRENQDLVITKIGEFFGN